MAGPAVYGEDRSEDELRSHMLPFEAYLDGIACEGVSRVYVLM